ncbi:MAG: xanthine dehydrogenase family protein molybdopterin-binding subunit [Cytophagaceae bacterium]|nr:xanthine dehydrogenase family protein molybdopterin-binding subunit [Gemmatimonadaceae bacterium]
MERRSFVKLVAVSGGGLAFAIRPSQADRAGQVSDEMNEWVPGAFLRIDRDGTVTVTVARADMGQGVRTALPMIVADELDADWDRVKIVQAEAHPDRYGRMMTVGSTSVRNGAWLPLRRAGATAREMLVAAAAAQWSVPASSLRTERGRVLHAGSGRVIAYGDLVDGATKQAVPSSPRLKTPDEFRIIGTSPKQLDTPAKVTGKAQFGIDARVPGMLFATVVHPPIFGSTVRSFDATAALAVAGVKNVVQVSQGVAVVAEHTGAALKGAKALVIAYDNTGFTASSPEIFEALGRLASAPALEAKRVGTPENAIAGAGRRVQAEYQAPYLAHATMEPMNCTADVRADRVELWAPTQNPQGAQQAASRLTGIPLDKVTVHTQLMGCGWGRRSRDDFVTDAVEVSKAIGAPVQVLWTREEDMQHDFYRPAAVVKLDGGVDAGGTLNALTVRIAAQGISGPRNGLDGNAVASIADTPYHIPNFLVEYARAENAVPVGYWRSVGPSQNTFVFESFIDEMAHAAGRDPVEFRRGMLAEEPRMLHVLNACAERAKWGSAVPAGRARGVALVEDKGGRVAEIAEVSLENGRIRVHRVTVVADCGQIIHPGIVHAQLSGSVVAGLTAALYGEITIEKGRVKQGNFNDYRMLRIGEMPEVDVHVVPSREEPGGVGEPGVPPIAAAVANALFTLTGVRARRLPLGANWRA